MRTVERLLPVPVWDGCLFRDTELLEDPDISQRFYSDSTGVKAGILTS